VNPRIERLQRQSARDGDAICLAGGLPSPQQFPRRALADAFVRAVADPAAAALQYGWPEGIDPLRAWIAEHLGTRGLRVRPEDVIVTSGAQQALAIAARLQLRPGQRIGVDRESYPAALDLFRARGNPPASSGLVHAHYAMPAVANPRGNPMDAGARARLLASGLPILEDDAYALLAFDGPPPPPLAAEARARVWHVGTFSKILCPGLRLGWLVPPPLERARALQCKRDLDLQASSLAQVIAADFLRRDRLDARLARLRRFYRRRAGRLARALTRWLPGWRFAMPSGGFSIWIETGAALDDADFLAEALRHGVSFDPGRSFRPDEAGRPLALRLCYSLERAARLDEGVERLARAWAAFTQSTKLRVAKIVA
jgi:2-aminoadipate transaminase